MKWKRLATALTALSLVASLTVIPNGKLLKSQTPTSIIASAAEESNYKDLEIVVFSDKDKYGLDETAEIKIVAENTSGNVLENITLTSYIPQGLTIDENDASTLEIDRIEPNQSVELVLHVRKAIESDEVAPTESSGNTKAVNLSNLSVATTNTATTAVVTRTSETTKVETTTKINSTPTENPKTGSDVEDTFAIGVIALLVAGASVGLAKYTKKSNKVLVLLICAGMTSSLILPDISVLAQAEDNNISDISAFSEYSIALPVTIYIGDTRACSH